MVNWLSTKVLSQFSSNTIVFSTNGVKTNVYPYLKKKELWPIAHTLKGRSYTYIKLFYNCYHLPLDGRNA